MLTNDFYYLQLPQTWRGGIGKGKWAVCTIYSCGEPYTYLYSDLQLHEAVIDKEDNSNGFFDTKFDILIAIKSYYAKYGEVFPYREELTEELGKLGITIKEANESQVMEFI